MRERELEPHSVTHVTVKKRTTRTPFYTSITISTTKFTISNILYNYKILRHNIVQYNVMIEDIS